ncbi:hypothetical protein [Candidatus Nitrosotalea okcheonensis]|nr:hypothetical protein [Candidatus Nitrosotalea okcheonensis]
MKSYNHHTDRKWDEFWNRRLVGVVIDFLIISIVIFVIAKFGRKSGLK